MKVLIIEDERPASRRLIRLLKEIDPEIKVINVLESVEQSVNWLFEYRSSELIFMDIQLEDGLCFEIFEKIRIKTPVIFITAYDEYALKAFKVNSIDYLLKPIDRKDIQKALDKLKLLNSDSTNKEPDYTSLLRALKKEENYKTHFLIPVKGDKLLPVSADSILFFHIDEGVVKAMMADGKEYIFPQTLDELTDSLNPAFFFRVNRQYLISRKAVLDIDLWFNGRLSVNMKVPVPEKILISKARVSEFKEWFAGG